MTKFISVLVLCLFLFPQSAPSDKIPPYEVLFNRSYPENLEAIGKVYEQVIAMDQQSAFAYIKNLKTTAEKHDNEEWSLEADLLKAYYIEFHNLKSNQQLVATMKKVELEAKEKNILHIRARALKQIAEIYWVLIGNYELGFDAFLRLDKLLETISNEGFPYKTQYLFRIGEAYFYFQNYRSAISFFKKATGIPLTKFNAQTINSSYNTMGLSYQKLGKLDSSSYYFKKIFSNPLVARDTVWKGIAYGNLGKNEYLKGNLKKAIPLLQYDFETAIQYEDYGLATGSGIILANIYIRRNDLDKSKFYIDTTRTNIEISEKTDRLRLLYPVMAKFYAKNGNAEKAVAYMDSTAIATKAYDRKFNSLILLRAQQKLNAQQRKLETARAILEKNKLTSERNRWILFMSIVCFILTILFLFQKRKRELKALELKLAKNKLEKKAQELEMASLKLENFTKRIQEKNRLLKKLQSHSDEEAAQLTEQLRESTILTPRDWDEFQNLFERAYPGFIHRLTEKYPHLTASEIRFFALSKLGLSTQDMVAMIGVSQNTMQVTMHRARKKLNLPDNRSLKNIADSI